MSRPLAHPLLDSYDWQLVVGPSANDFAFDEQYRTAAFERHRYRVSKFAADKSVSELNQWRRLRRLGVVREHGPKYFVHPIRGVLHIELRDLLMAQSRRRSDRRG